MVTNQFKKWLNKILDLPKKCTFQWARNSVATMLGLDPKVSMKVIQEGFGHTDMKTTLGYIATLIDEKEEEVKDALDFKN